MALDPWSYAEKTRTEHAEQTALFMWANMARMYGMVIAGMPESYTINGHARRSYNPNVDKLIPELEWLHAIKNAGHGDVIRGAMSKAEGVKAGVPDMFLPVPAVMYSDDKSPWTNGEFPVKCGLYIELKRLKSVRGAAGKTSAEQERWRNYLNSTGYKVEVCEGWLAARDAILRYLGKLPA